MSYEKRFCAGVQSMETIARFKIYIILLWEVLKAFVVDIWCIIKNSEVECGIVESIVICGFRCSSKCIR